MYSLLQILPVEELQPTHVLLAGVLRFWGCPGRTLPAEDLPEGEVQPYLHKSAMPLMSGRSCTSDIRPGIPGGWGFFSSLAAEW